MQTDSLSNDVKKIVFEYLPKIIKEQPEVRIALWDMLSDKFAPKEKTEDHFEKLLERMRAQEEKSDRKFEQVFKKLEENDRKFEQVFKKLEENDRKFDQIFKKLEENDKKFEEHSRRLEEHSRRFEEHSRRLEEDSRRFEEHSRRLEEHSRRFDTVLEEIRNVDHRIDRTIGALGARWGISTELAFREAIKAVVENFTDTKVERFLGFDNEGMVFGRPDQVEIDVVIRNGELWLMEIKSSVSKADIYAFDRKTRFYQTETKRKVDRKVIISPIINPRELKLAKDLNIKTYMAPEDIEREENAR